MKVLLTGCKGYIGSVLSQKLLRSGHQVIGLDCGFFEENLLEPTSEEYRYLRKDIRDVEYGDVEGVEAVIHLAALSNDPLGEFDPNITTDINLNGTIRLAQIAKKCGVGRFVFASTQSIYGVSRVDHELDEELSEKAPVTAYAKTKWAAEQYLKQMSSASFVTTSLRPSTVFGWSPRLRTDIVFNNFMACAFLTNKIEILSDGTPWRPVVHVEDVCQAFIAGVEAPPSLISGCAFNVGIPRGNFSVRELAEAAAKVVTGSEVEFCGGHIDPRSYKVSFKRISKVLEPWYRPEWSLHDGGNQLVQKFSDRGFTEKCFRGRETVRLKQLAYLKEENLIDEDFRWSSDK